MSDDRLVLKVLFALGLVATVGAACAGKASTGGSGATTTPTDGVSTTGGTPGIAAEGEKVSFGELVSRQQELVGHAVDVEGTAHFVVNCPPPGGPSGPCVLNGYFAEPDRDSLPYGEIGEAFPITEGGTLVSCGQATASGGACSGWEQGQHYRIVAMVEHRVSGGRPTEQIELGVTSKTPA